MSAVAGRTPLHLGGLNDDELVHLARAGNEEAFDAIVHRYRAPLVSYCRRWLDAHRSEEVVQHTLMKAFLCVRDDDRPLVLRPWLYRVAHNAALNAVEKKGSDWEELDENYDGVPQPPQVAEQRARFLRVVGEIEALPDRQREALLLNEFEGRCYADIAAQLGTSESGVRGLLRRARHQLRETAAAVLLPIPVLRELVRSDGGRAGDLIGSAGAAGGVGAAGGFAKVAAGVLATGAIAGGGTAIQHSDDPLRSPEAKAADSSPAQEATKVDDVRSVVVAALDQKAAGPGPSSVSQTVAGSAHLVAGAGLDRGGTDGGDAYEGGDWLDGVESSPPAAEEPAPVEPEEPALEVEPPITLVPEAEEEPTAGSEEPAAEEPTEPEPKNNGQSKKDTDSANSPTAEEQPGPSTGSPDATPAEELLP